MWNVVDINPCRTLHQQVGHSPHGKCATGQSSTILILTVRLHQCFSTSSLKQTFAQLWLPLEPHAMIHVSELLHKAKQATPKRLIRHERHDHTHHKVCSSNMKSVFSELVPGDFGCSLTFFNGQWQSGGTLGCHWRNCNPGWKIVTSGYTAAGWMVRLTI